jgi:hypothetical protein
MADLFYGNNCLQETPRGYSSSARQNFIYEVSLRTKDGFPWLSDLLQAHRLVQALTQGRLLELYELLDFLIWPEGFFLRVRLQNIPTLSDFLEFLKEKTTVGGTAPLSWEDEPQWIRPIPPERLAESTRLFLQNAEQLRIRLKNSDGQSPSLFFFYRNSRLVP